MEIKFLLLLLNIIIIIIIIIVIVILGQNNSRLVLCYLPATIWVSLGGSIPMV